MGSLRLADKIERWPIERLTPYAANPRTHTEEQISQIVASIAEFGFTNPILVDAEGGIVAGHGRVLAARKLGLAEVPVIVLGHLNEAQKRAYVIADNKLALNAGWDEALLAAELRALEKDEFPLDLTGFNSKEIDALFASVAQDLEEETEPDDIPEPPNEPVARPGDLWLLGPHILLCGDALDPAAYEVLLEGEPAAMVFTDPPYNVAYGAGDRERKRGRSRPILNDDLGVDFADFLERACANLIANTDGAVYICMSSSELHTLQQAFTAAGGHWSTFLIWAKGHFTLGRSDYQRQYEPILYGWKGGAKRYWSGARDQGDLWLYDKPRVNDLHPTMKPIPLIERALRNSSRRGDRVLDPFAGSGSTVMACEATGRAARAIELDPGYCDVIARRWQKHTGQDSIRGSDGATLAELETNDE